MGERDLILALRSQPSPCLPLPLPSLVAPGPHCTKPLSGTLPAFAVLLPPVCHRISASSLFSRETLLPSLELCVLLLSLPGGQFLPLTTSLHSISGWDGPLLGPHSGLLTVRWGSAELLCHEQLQKPSSASSLQQVPGLRSRSETSLMERD